jgi:lipopolysaccharide export system protein LptA
MTHHIHAITSDNLDLSFDENLATISDNVIYKNLNTRMQADKIEIDLITKNSKIFMNDKLKKVKIININ